MKYGAKAFKHSDGRWGGAKYLEPEGKLLAGGLVQTPVNEGRFNAKTAEIRQRLS